MACSGSYCGSHCISYGCSSGHRGVCPSNVYDINTPNTDVWYAERINKLRTAVAQERYSRNAHPKFSIAALAGSNVNGADPDYTAADTIEASDLTNIKTTLNAMAGMSYDNTGTGASRSYAAGDQMEAADLEELRTLLNQLSTDCICNSDCGSNSWCSCHGNCGNNYSDERLKKEIEPLEYGLDDIKALKPVTFKYRGDTDPDTHMGYIAQDVKKQFDGLAVWVDDRGYLGLRMHELVPVLANAIKELDAKVEELTKKIQEK